MACRERLSRAHAIRNIRAQNIVCRTNYVGVVSLAFLVALFRRPSALVYLGLCLVGEPSFRLSARFALARQATVGFVPLAAAMSINDSFAVQLNGFLLKLVRRFNPQLAVRLRVMSPAGKTKGAEVASELQVHDEGATSGSLLLLFLQRSTRSLGLASGGESPSSRCRRGSSPGAWVPWAPCCCWPRGPSSPCCWACCWACSLSQVRTRLASHPSCRASGGPCTCSYPFPFYPAAHASLRNPNLKARFSSAREDLKAAWRGAVGAGENPDLKL